ncbi:MAG: N(4)-(beta-N-acetylglucosaminyl)-L-asparaginase [Sphingomonadales bacterium]|nr:N(4)-(beta-N-acetylglucosaminyl)-L-asparaginase [Sphingomonadales bacterium]
MKRRQFIRFGAVVGALSLVETAKASQILAQGAQGSAKGPIVLSTWNHGLAANEGAWAVLQKGGSALDAVEKGVMVTEADLTNRSVGVGGRPDRDGHVTLDACIMSGDARCGSVAFLEGIAHPISVARAIMERTQHVMLVGDGARQFALAQGFATAKMPIDEVKKDYEKWRKENKDLFKKPEINHENHDTIGMIAMDAQGQLAGACTTSGWAYKMHGRIGDSPIIGAGLFVDDEVGAATATGLGEAIVRVAGSHTVVELMRQGYTPFDACKEACMRIIRKHKDLSGLQCGFIALDKNGNYGAYSIYAGFNFALRNNEGEALVDAKFDRNW